MAKFRTKEKEDEKTYKHAVTIAQIKFSKPRNSGQNYPKESKIHQGNCLEERNYCSQRQSLVMENVIYRKQNKQSGEEIREVICC